MRVKTAFAALSPVLMPALLRCSNTVSSNPASSSTSSRWRANSSGDRLVILECLDRERPGHAQPLLVFDRLIVKRLLFRRLLVSDRLQRHVRHFFVNESVTHIAPMRCGTVGRVTP